MLEEHPFQLEKLVTDVSQMLAYKAHEKGLQLLVWVDPQLPQELECDSLHLSQILLNLLSNAIKFTQQGYVYLALTETSCQCPDTGLRITVEDTGMGIDPQQQQYLFDAFNQGDTSTTRKFGGTGLGLAICQRLVYIMGGVALAGRAKRIQVLAFSYTCRKNRLGAI